MKCNLSKITRIEDLRPIAKRKMSCMFYDHTDLGSRTETTYRESTSGFKDICLRQEVLVNMEGRSPGIRMIGQGVKMPVVIAPIGFMGMVRADDEILMVRTAEKFGISFTSSTMFTCSIEDAAENTSTPFWLQLYTVRDRKFMESLTKRAKDVNCSALVLTTDLQVLGQCYKDIKNSLSAPPKPIIADLINLAAKPGWCAKMLSMEYHTLRNIVGHAEDMDDSPSLSSWASEQFDPRLSWDDMARIKDLQGGKLIIKDIMEFEDAEKVARSGADVLAVSNHGDRQLDDAVSTIKTSPGIVSAVGSDIEVWIDSGIRSDQNILEVWALSTKGTMINRALLYSLGAYDEEGVICALRILYRETGIFIAFIGHRNIQDVDFSVSRSTRRTQDEF